MTDEEFENEIYEILVANQMKNEGMALGGIFKKLKKAARKIVKKVKKVIIPATKIGLAFVAGGPVGASVAAGKLGASELAKKKAKKAAEKARKQSLEANKAAIAAELLAQEGVNFNSPQARDSLGRYINSPRDSGVMKYVLPAAGGAAVLVLLLNR